MKEIRLLGFSMLLICLLVSPALTLREDVTARTREAGLARAAGAGENCNDCLNTGAKPEDCCKKPVRRNGDREDGCYCFACEYGTNRQHIVCTRNESIKAKLFGLIEDVVPDTLREDMRR